MEEKATLRSQFFGEDGPAEDTEEIFWLRQSDDYQSKVALGNELSRQYRFREAAEAYEEALRIRDDDPMTWLRVGGARLTLLEFERAMAALEQVQAIGGSEQSVAYHMGFWHYLRGDYAAAARWFLKCLPCGDEMRIAVIYWHTLSCVRAGTVPELLADYDSNMDVGHHKAYQDVVAVFHGEEAPGQAAERAQAADDLSCAITCYGLTVYLEQQRQEEKARTLRKTLLERDGAWPCLSYLAAWHDAYS